MSDNINRVSEKVDKIKSGYHNSASEILLSIQNVPVYFQEDWRVGIGGGLWSTGLAMAKYFASVHHPLSCIQKIVTMKGRNLMIVELGSGNGFLSVCLAALAAPYIQQLIVTDTLEHLPMIHHTLAANAHIINMNVNTATDHVEKSPTCEKVNTICIEHRWGVFEEFNNQDMTSFEQKMRLKGQMKFDLIIGSDVVYREELYEPFIQSLQQFSDSTTVSLIGVTMVDTTPNFFVLLEKAGFCFERLADHLMEPEFRGTTFGIFVIQKK